MNVSARAARRRAATVFCGLAALLVIPSMAQAAGQKWAVVNSAGALVRSNGGVSAAHLGTGVYEVIFNANMTGCAYSATAGDIGAGAVSGPVGVTVASRASNVNGVFYETIDESTGALVDAPVHIVTTCGTKKFAVVSAAGTLARGTAGVVVNKLGAGTGNYEVIFTKAVSKCAFVATVGTTSTGSIADAGSITVAGRAGNARGVFVHVMDRAGAPLDQSFHLAVNCGKRTLLAVEESSGVTVRGANVVSSAKLSGAGGGTYQVIFNRTVASCAYVATVGVTGNSGAITSPVQITTATRAGNPNGVFVFIHSNNGATIDEPFHLTVFC
jgi:hypothetical protein